MSGNVKTIDPSSNLCEVVASLKNGDTLILSPGVYNVDDRVVVNKDVVVKSSTDDPRDVVIVREGATVLFVKKGASTFENITFVSTSPTEDSFIEKDDDVRMRGAVAVRGGSPAFKGCRATAAKQNGFSVVGLGVSAQFIRCLTQETNLAGLLFANG
ncbi:MAG: hypothetical protein IKX88_12430, partial [Thermoguttaceae bacterium]|nr:hypothetical protein [Thermoguttaceae bacterium]